MGWTDKQLDVMNTRDRNILVSAAAGSGKTAVLVERIIRLITDKENPVNIDELLVVTFTRAAAMEMKERVRTSLEKLAEKYPNDENLAKQISYIHNAKITTIDSFCTSVVKEHFEKIDMDPNYRIGDETELDMLKADILEEMLEEYYEQESSEFMELARQYTSGKMVDHIGGIIVSLHHYASGYYNPKKWIENCSIIYDIKSAKELEQTKPMQYFIEHFKQIFEGMENELQTAYEMLLSGGEEKPAMAIATLLDIVKLASKAEDYTAMQKALLPITETITLRISKQFPEDLKAQISDLKKSVTESCKKILKDYFADSLDEIYEDVVESRNAVHMIIHLTLDFMERFENAKKEKGIVDFTDQAHMALRILNDEDENGCLVPSDIARKMSYQYKEIMIDEYQDSNYIQEAILSAVSGGYGVGNMFMVGDVKQSIYRFRQAEPKLFLHKFDSFSDDLKAENCRIILDKNFRSRKEIIDSVNFVFDYIMHRELGGIDYKQDNRLTLGADFDDVPKGQDNRSEFIMLDVTDRADEAEYVAQKILEITDAVHGMKITEKNHNMRPVRYGDIAILLRGMKGVSDIYQEHLENNGIPSFAENKVGFYQAKEVQTILNFLAIIDNPRQDIPLVATMFSPMFQFTEEDLATIKTASVSDSFYESIKIYGIDGNEDLLKKKTVEFISLLEKFREMVPYTSVYELINHILEETGYEHYVKSMVNGKKRYLNLETLKEKAVAFDKISYKGLFNFVRYIERIKEMSKDEGELSLEGEFEDTVRIMSIHKSKGLQYPVVFLCDTSSASNSNSDKIVMDDKGNIGIDYMNPVLKTKSETIYKKAINLYNKDEDIAEKLRILYVALTRAKEKLFITARGKNMESTARNFAMQRYQKNEKLSYNQLTAKASFMDWIGNAVGRNQAFDEIIGTHEFDAGLTNALYSVDSGFKVSYVPKECIIASEIQRNFELEKKEETLQILSELDVSNQDEQMFKEMLEYIYPYEKYVTMYSKASVTELKKQSMAYEEEQDGEALFSKESNIYQKEIIPEFAKEIKEEIYVGAKRGTAYHRVFELLDMSKEEYTAEMMKEMLEGFVSSGKIDRESADCINVADIVKFTRTTLYKRMKQAYDRGELYRERKFLMGVSAGTLEKVSDLKRDTDSQQNFDDTMIIQGIIDVCFLEDGKYVLADYKTDKVSDMQELVKRYKVQLESYKLALEQIAGIEVSEMIIYSVALNDEISL